MKKFLFVSVAIAALAGCMSQSHVSCNVKPKDKCVDLVTCSCGFRDADTRNFSHVPETPPEKPPEGPQTPEEPGEGEHPHEPEDGPHEPPHEHPEGY